MQIGASEVKVKRIGERLQINQKWGQFWLVASCVRVDARLSLSSPLSWGGSGSSSNNNAYCRLRKALVAALRCALAWQWRIAAAFSWGKALLKRTTHKLSASSIGGRRRSHSARRRRPAAASKTATRRVAAHISRCCRAPSSLGRGDGGGHSQRRTQLDTSCTFLLLPLSLPHAARHLPTQSIGRQAAEVCLAS